MSCEIVKEMSEAFEANCMEQGGVMVENYCFIFKVK